MLGISLGFLGSLLFSSGSSCTTLDSVKQKVLVRQLMDAFPQVVSPEEFLAAFRQAFDMERDISALDRLKAFNSVQLSNTAENAALVTYYGGARNMGYYFSQLGDWHVLDRLASLGLLPLASPHGMRAILNAQHPETRETLWHAVVQATDLDVAGIEFLLSHRATPHLKNAEERQACSESFSLLLKIARHPALLPEKKLNLIGKLVKAGWDPFREQLLAGIPEPRKYEQVAKAILENLNLSERTQATMIGEIGSWLEAGSEDIIDSGIEALSYVRRILEHSAARLVGQLDKWRWSLRRDPVKECLEVVLSLLKQEGEALRSGDLEPLFISIERYLERNPPNRGNSELIFLHRELRAALTNFRQNFLQPKLSELITQFTARRDRHHQEMAAQEARHAEEKHNYNIHLAGVQEARQGLAQLVATQAAGLAAQSLEIETLKVQVAQLLTQFQNMPGTHP